MRIIKFKNFKDPLSAGRPSSFGVVAEGCGGPQCANGGDQWILGGAVGQWRRRQQQQKNWLVEVTEDGSARQSGAAPGGK